MVFLTLFCMLIVILVAAEIFTNALEHLGEKLEISEGVTGSLFAAVGTALPEASVPIIAIFAGTQNAQTNHEIGVGAILGAPLMLATLSIFLMAMSVFKARGVSGHLRPERTGLKRDLNYFIGAFLVAAIALYIPHENIEAKIGIGLLMIAIYVVYIVQTLRSSKALVEEGHATSADEPMFLNKVGIPTNGYTITLQILLGLALLVAGAKGFIGGVEEAASILGISALLLSLLVIPIATELPEKVNSILWIRKGKDTLAFGNITGAMVFQGTLLPAIGIMLTPWQPQSAVVTGFVITLIAAIWLRVMAEKGQLRVWHIMLNGGLYISYLVLVLA